MQNQLISFVGNIKQDRRIISFDEAAAKQAVVLKILTILGWDTFNIDEVTPEYSISGKRVDYSLRINNFNKAFIEVKRPGEDLENIANQEQLLNYSFQEGVKLALLTNGITWLFYLPLHEGSWEQRKFYTIDIVQQEAADVTSKFISFLSKGMLSSGEAVKNAEAIYKGQQKVNILKESLPKAWNKIIEEADELLIDLINDTTEKLCGYKAESALVEQFLSKHKNNLIIFETSRTRPATRPTVARGPVSTSDTESYTGRSISSFYFKGLQHEVRSWKDMLIKLCEVFNLSHRNEFDKLLSLVGRKRPYFTRNANELRIPQKINKTDIFVETNLSANNIVKICLDMMVLFGYSKGDLKIEAR